VIALVALAYSKLKWLNNLSQVPSLVYMGLIGKYFSLIRLKKLFPLYSDAWNIILPVTNYKVTLFFFAKIPRQFAREIRYVLKLFGLFIDVWMMNSFSTAWAISKGNQVIRSFTEKFSEVLRYCNRL